MRVNSTLMCLSPFSMLSPNLQYAFKVPFGLLAVISTFLNAVVVGLFLKEKSLRTYSNAFYMSLVVSDLFIGSVLSPLTVVELSLPLEKQNCILSNTEMALFSLLSVPALTISGIAYERVHLSSRGDAQPQFMATWKKLSLLAVPWISALILIGANLLVSRAISWMLLAIYVFSYALLIASYLRLLRFLGKRRDELNQFRDSSAKRYLLGAIHRQNQKVTRLILSITVAFIACTLLMFFHIILVTTSMQVRGVPFFDIHGPLIFAVAMVMYQLNSALNPVLYFVKHQEFRRALRRRLRKRRAKVGMHPSTVTRGAGVRFPTPSST